MSPDDVVVQCDTELLGSRKVHSNNHLVQHSRVYSGHDTDIITTQNYSLTNNEGCHQTTKSLGAVVNNPRCWDGEHVTDV